MDIISQNKAYYDTISSISNQLNEFFTKKGWITNFSQIGNGVYYYYLNKLDEFGLKLDNYNKFHIIVDKKHSENYIKSHPEIIINNNNFSINLNNINVNVYIRSDNSSNFDNHMMSLNNINVLHYNHLFQHMKILISKVLNETLVMSEFNSENIDKSIKFHRRALNQLLYFKTLEKINKLMNEHQTQEALSHTTQQPVPIFPKLTRSLSVLLEAANYIDNQDNIDNTEPLAKKK